MTKNIAPLPTEARDTLTSAIVEYCAAMRPRAAQIECDMLDSSDEQIAEYCSTLSDVELIELLEILAALWLEAGSPKLPAGFTPLAHLQHA